MTTVVVGAGGLIGSAAMQAASRQSHTIGISGLPWDRPDEAQVSLRLQLRDAAGARAGDGLVVLWCAGGGRVGATAVEMDRELELLQQGTSTLVEMADDGRDVVVCLASSAGGVWSGSPERVLHEDVPADPWHDYGRGKLAQEQLLTDVAGNSGLRTISARISNVFGCPPPDKPVTGLVNHMVRNAIRRTPTAIYVPLDTQRDYISSKRVAATMHGLARTALQLPRGTASTRVVAEGRSVTISHLGVIIGRVLGRRVPLTVGHSPTASQQPRALSFRSVHRDLQRPGDHLAHEVAAVVREMLAQVR